MTSLAKLEREPLLPQGSTISESGIEDRGLPSAQAVISGFHHQNGLCDLSESFEDLGELAERIDVIKIDLFETNTIGSSGNVVSDGSSGKIVSDASSTAATTAVAVLQVIRGIAEIKEAKEEAAFVKGGVKIVKATSEGAAAISDGGTKIVSSLQSSHVVDSLTKVFGITSLAGLSGAGLTLLTISAMNIYETTQAYKNTGAHLDVNHLINSIERLKKALDFNDGDKTRLLSRICETPGFKTRVTSFLEEKSLERIYTKANLKILRSPSKEALDNLQLTPTDTTHVDENNLPPSWKAFLDNINEPDRAAYLQKLNSLLSSGYEEAKKSAEMAKESKFDRTFGADVRADLKIPGRITDVRMSGIVEKAQSNLRKHMMISFFKMISSIAFSILVVFTQIKTCGLIDQIASILSLVVPSLFLMTEVFKSFGALEKKLKSIVSAIVNIVKNVKSFFENEGKLEKIKNIFTTIAKDLMLLSTLLLGVIFYVVTKFFSGVATTAALASLATLCTFFMIWSFIDSQSKTRAQPQPIATNSAVGSSI